MRSKVLLGVLLPFAVISATLAQVAPVQSENATIAFPDIGPREVWIQPAPCTGPAPDSIKPGTAMVEIPIGRHNDTDAVYVWDHKTGNMATSTVGVLRKTMNLSLDTKAFADVAEVKVGVEHSGQPLAAAEVRVDDGRKPQTQLLDPSTKGELTFWDLKPGQLKVTAKYKAKDGSAKSITQLVDAALGKGDPSATATISVADDVATVSPSSAPVPGTTGSNPPTGAEPSAGAPPGGNANSKGGSNGGNGIGSAFAYLIGLGIVAGLLYLAWRYMKQNPDAVQTKLQQLGVDIPKPGDDPRNYDPVGPPAPRKADPPQKIILTDAAPDLMAPIPASNVVTVTGEPRLLSESGDAMTLPQGETVVGRDVGLGLSLVGESTVSRRHAQLVRNGNDVTVTDLGSTNGTYVNGVALTAPQPLRPGDTVQFGAVRFRFDG